MPISFANRDTLATSFPFCVLLILLSLDLGDSLCQPDTNCSLFEKKKARLRKYLHQNGPWASPWHIFLINYWYGSGEKPIVIGTITKPWSYGAIRKEEPQAIRSKPESSTPSWSLQHLLPLGSCPAFPG